VKWSAHLEETAGDEGVLLCPYLHKAEVVLASFKLGGPCDAREQALKISQASSLRFFSNTSTNSDFSFTPRASTSPHLHLMQCASCRSIMLVNVFRWAR
jgi:hypothetical protein